MNNKLKSYFGSAPIVVHAQPMTLGGYNEFRGWELPSDENVNTAGYLIEYLDTTANTANYAGYVTWASKAEFEKAYCSTGNLSCGHAIELLTYSDQIKLARHGWMGGEQLLFNDDGEIKIKDVNGDLVTWTPTQDDLLNRDYYIVEEVQYAS